MQPIDLRSVILAEPPNNASFYTVAIDGRGGSGKTCLSEYLEQLLPGFVFLNGDDYFEPIQSDATWGDFNDYRFLVDVLKPLQVGNRFMYRSYDWDVGAVAGAVDVTVDHGVCIERCYSFAMPLDWDLRIWVETPSDVCLARGIKREHMPEYRARRAWEQVWQPREDEYIARVKPMALAAIVVDGERPFSGQLV